MPNMQSDFHAVKFYYELWVSALIFWLLLDQAKSDSENQKINHKDLIPPKKI
jgi:hypothetical protein